MASNLKRLDAQFKEQHFLIIDNIDAADDDSLSKEQEALDTHDEELSTISLRIDQLIKKCTLASDSGSRKIVSRSIVDLDKRFSTMETAFSSLSGKPEEAHLYHHYQGLLQDFKGELGVIRQNMLSMGAEGTEELFASVTKLNTKFSDVSMKIMAFLHPHKKSVTADKPERSTTDTHGVKLPKLDVPLFDGDILNWTTFWEQFSVAIHDRLHLSDAEKLAYLRHSLKDGTAKSTIEGLSRSGDYYNEAVQCLKDRYNRPKLIHQAHVKRIVEIPPLKEGNGKELRRLHDTAQQHLRALKSIGHEPEGTFITSFLQLKLDETTLFEWQKHNQKSPAVSHYNDLLAFINLRAQASETLTMPQRRHTNKDEHASSRKHTSSRTMAFTATASETCIVCKVERHPLFTCPEFRAMSHDKMLSTLRSKGLCLNCLKPGHFAKQCPSSNKCKKCQRSHHTLIHNDSRESQGTPAIVPSPPATMPARVEANHHNSHTSTGSTIPTTLLMTCQVKINAPDGSSIRARALLDSGSTTSFVSERIVQCLGLARRSKCLTITGIGGLTHNSPLQSVSTFEISSLYSPKSSYTLTAIVVPRVTNDLPLQPVQAGTLWNHLSNLALADPDYGTPGRIDLLLGADIYADVLLHGRRCGPAGTPTAFETQFGWVLTGRTSTSSNHISVASHHSSVTSNDDVLRMFWEIEESPTEDSNLSTEERMVVRHFKENHTRSETGRFIVPLPKDPSSKPLGESKSQAVRRFLSLERSLYSKGQFQPFSTVMNEYFDLGHAEPVPASDLNKPSKETFYLPMHAVYKEHSTTTKVRVVFDASAKSSTGTSLNDILLVGPTVHSSLIDVLLRFRFHRIALTADVSKMYRAIELTHSDRDLHRFVWRNKPGEPLVEYRMTRVTFGVSASSYAANMAVKQNAIDHSTKFPQAAEAVNKSFYVDDCLTGADSIPEAIELQSQLQTLFSKGDFTLRKWNSSETEVLQNIPIDLKDAPSVQTLPAADEYTKTLGIEWNTTMDHFRLTIADLPPLNNITKRVLVSDIAKTFDVLGWFSPTIIKVKILLQRLWEQKIDWDDAVPSTIYEDWFRWRSELHLLSNKHIPRCYFDKKSQIVSVQLHGFCDASEDAYAAVIYLRMVDSYGNVQVSLVASKTKVSPIKRLTIPRLELCSAHLLAQLLFHIKNVFNLSLTDVFAWTDSTIVLSWFIGNPRRFKTYVGNRVSYIIDLIAPDRWNHVQGLEKPADCASRGLFPSELLDHTLWWNGPTWLHLSPTHWPNLLDLPNTDDTSEERELSLHASSISTSPILRVEDYSSFAKLKRVISWVFRFIDNCRGRKPVSNQLTTDELHKAERYWFSVAQNAHFSKEVELLQSQSTLDKSSQLIPLRPLLDSFGILRVGGRQENSQMSYSQKHPIILHQKHPLTHLIIRSEHLRLLHAGATLLTASLCRQYHIIGCKSVVRSITRGCITCRKLSTKPINQMLGQLPAERLTPGPIFNKVGIDFAGPIYVKYAHIRKPVIVKAYVCLFVSLSVKAVHLEPVSDLTSDAFIATLRRFVARRGKPTLIMSDHGTNFTGADRELKEMHQFLNQENTQDHVSNFCSTQGITWKFIPERAPHFGGLWEAAVKSMKYHFKRVVGNTKLTFEELTTVLTQIEACLNSRPLAPLPSDDDGIEALTPGHFLIGQPLESIPDPSLSYRSMSLLKRWYLCQALVRHFWKRWSDEYLSSLRRQNKWKHPTRNIKVGDIVVLQDDNLIPARWPLAKVVTTHPGKDGLVRVVTVKTSTGTYKRPVAKVALLMPQEK